MDALRQAIEDERFELRLKQNTQLDPEQKKKRWYATQTKTYAGDCCFYPKEGDSFDRLEYPKDVPIIPDAGSTLPSQRMMRMKRQ